METIVSSSTLTWGFRLHPVRTPTPPRSFHATINRPPFIAVSQSRKLRIGLFGLSSSYFSSPSSTRKLSVSCDLKEITETEFSEVVLKSDLPVLVEFVASWCGPCRLIRSTMESIAQDYKEKLMVVKIDHDSNPKLIEEYKVYGLPSLIFFKNGQEVPESRREGAITKVKLKEYIDTLLESVSAV